MKISIETIPIVLQQYHIRKTTEDDLQYLSDPILVNMKIFWRGLVPFSLLPLPPLPATSMDLAVSLRL